MIYFADLHVHSKYSRATSRDCNLVELARWAAIKGIRVLATGDLTHPAWFDEIRTHLREHEAGSFRLKGDYVPEVLQSPGSFGADEVTFVLNVEISSIYKKNGATRKVHNLIFLPDMEAAERFNTTLGRIGNIESDGRPILGLDSRDLLEIALEASSDAYLVPAHVWTPWFSVLGSKSGFDTVEECFEDLTPHVFALETGLSSDPEMNRRVGSLDPYVLISNSDTHSPANLGREVNIFAGATDYFSIRNALRDYQGPVAYNPDATSPAAELCGENGRAAMSGTQSDPPEGARFLGTIEYFPEEGKYHLDGHRKCSARMEPYDTESLDGKCPVCGRPVTVGVMNRVMELSGREPGTVSLRDAPFRRMLTLREIAAQSLGVGAQSKKVAALYSDLIARLGPELSILWALEMDEIAAGAPAIVTEAIKRVRAGNVHIEAGYDGEYGTVRLFTDDERAHFAGQDSFLPVRKASSSRARVRGRKTKASGTTAKDSPPDDPPSGREIVLNDEQHRAVNCWDRPVIVKAGPGAGKTRTLIQRITTLLTEGSVSPEHITAVTFTRRAAGEMQERLAATVGESEARKCGVGTFHQLGRRILDHFTDRGLAEAPTEFMDEDEALLVFKNVLQTIEPHRSAIEAASLFRRLSLCKQNLLEPSDPGEAAVYRTYEERLRARNAVDLDGLLTEPVRLLERHPEEAENLRRTWTSHLLIDEFQDVNAAQYRLVRLLSSADTGGLFVIGDPDQAVYGFRGSDRRFFLQLVDDYPDALFVHLNTNYRSPAHVLEAAAAILDVERMLVGDEEKNQAGTVCTVTLPTPDMEARFIVRAVETMLGGGSFLTVDSGNTPTDAEHRGLHDFAVLYRLNAVGDVIERAMKSAGIPCRRHVRSNPKVEAEEIDPRAQAVHLLTAHAAKGLQFPVVFVAGCEDGVFPYFGTDDLISEDERLEEEARLFYVAMTRAEEKLFLTRASRRMLFGESIDRESRFLSRLPARLCGLEDGWTSERKKKSKGPVQCELF